MLRDITKILLIVALLGVSALVGLSLYELKDYAKEEVKENKEEEIKYIYNDESYKYGFNLPLVVINTYGEEIESKPQKSHIQIYDNEKGDNYISDVATLAVEAYINVRGNTTKYFPKKQYNIELITSSGNEKEEYLLSMEKDSKWILNGPFADKSLMRNYIVYKVGRNIMEYAPDVRYCEVFVVDDESDTLQKRHYKGVYILLEKISRSKDRVDIIKSQDNIDDTSFIISKDRNKSGDTTINSYGYETYIYDYAININYPGSNKLTQGKYEFISRYINEFERVLYSDKFNDINDGYRKYIDVDSFVDFYIINEFFYNTDAGILSTYFHKNYNDKLKAGPIWDFNRSIGNTSRTVGQPYQVEGFFMNQRSWFDRLLEDQFFSDRVIDRYKMLRRTYLSDKYLISLIDETVLYLGDAVDRNMKTWPIYMLNQADLFKEYDEYFKPYENDPQKLDKFMNTQDIINLYLDTDGLALSYEEEIEFMKKYIIDRGKWIDNNIESLKKWSMY